MDIVCRYQYRSKTESRNVYTLHSKFPGIEMHTTQGQIQEVKFGVCETVSEVGGLGVALGPQWVQGEALVGAKEANPPETPEFQRFYSH
jgi:hypothetical protein